MDHRLSKRDGYVGSCRHLCCVGFEIIDDARVSKVMVRSIPHRAVRPPRRLSSFELELWSAEGSEFPPYSTYRVEEISKWKERHGDDKS